MGVRKTPAAAGAREGQVRRVAGSSPGVRPSVEGPVARPELKSPGTKVGRQGGTRRFRPSRERADRSPSSENPQNIGTKPNAYNATGFNVRGLKDAIKTKLGLTDYLFNRRLNQNLPSANAEKIKSKMGEVKLQPGASPDEQLRGYYDGGVSRISGEIKDRNLTPEMLALMHKKLQPNGSIDLYVKSKKFLAAAHTTNRMKLDDEWRSRVAEILNLVLDADLVFQDFSGLLGTAHEFRQDIPNAYIEFTSHMKAFRPPLED